MHDHRVKIKTLSALKKEIDHLKSEGKKIIFTNGCFDILHSGHARYLFAAKALGDYLVVAVNSDRSVRSIKGERRPVTPENERAELLAALGCVDGVVIFDEDHPLKVIESLMPDILVKGGDWAEDEIIGADAVRKAGGTVHRIAFVQGYSTTDIIERIKKNSGLP